ncbi:hypothetical protein GCM10009840_21140 [Pseudolysinimonas kribbensis]
MVVAMRHLRKLARSRSYVRVVTVDRVNERTGEVRERRVRRRHAYLAGRSTGTGFLSVNDGPSTARDIARLLAADRGEPHTLDGMRDSWVLVA